MLIFVFASLYNYKHSSKFKNLNWKFKCYIDKPQAADDSLQKQIITFGTWNCLIWLVGISKYCKKRIFDILSICLGMERIFNHPFRHFIFFSLSLSISLKEMAKISYHPFCLFALKYLKMNSFKQNGNWWERLLMLLRY